MVQWFVPPPKFYYEKLVAGARADQVFETAKRWVASEQGRVVEERAPHWLIAHHGRRRYTWGTEPDAPKVIEFWLVPAPRGVRLRVTAYPRRRAQGGAANEPELAREAYAKALQGLRDSLGVLSPEELAKPALLPAWEDEVSYASRQVRRARVELAGAVAILGVLGAYVQSTNQAIAGGPLGVVVLLARALAPMRWGDGCSSVGA